MNLSISMGDQTTIVTVAENRLDAEMAARFKERLRDAIGRGAQTILLDLGQVEFMDSSGLGAIIAVRKTMPEGRQMQLVRLTPNVERVFRLTRMDQVFDILPDLPAPATIAHPPGVQDVWPGAVTPAGTAAINVTAASVVPAQSAADLSGADSPTSGLAVTRPALTGLAVPMPPDVVLSDVVLSDVVPPGPAGAGAEIVIRDAPSPVVLGGSPSATGADAAAAAPADPLPPAAVLSEPGLTAPNDPLPLIEGT